MLCNVKMWVNFFLFILCVCPVLLSHTWHTLLSKKQPYTFVNVNCLNVKKRNERDKVSVQLNKRRTGRHGNERC